MLKRKPNKKNSTLLKLHGTPFKTANLLKLNMDKILLEEWQNIERARVRRELFLREENKLILAPLTNGITAKFVGHNDKKESLVRVYLNDDHDIQIDLDETLRGRDNAGLSDSLIKSLVSGLMNGYLGALGLISDSSLLTQIKEVKK